MSLLDDIVKTRFPKLAPTRWSYSARLVETVQHNLEDLLQLFEHIVETPQSFDQKSINEAQGFLLTLSGFDFNILLQIYGLVFPFTQNLYNILQSKSMDILFCVKEIETTMKKLEEIKTSKFSGIWKNVKERCGMPTCRKVRFSLQPEVQKQSIIL